MKRIAIKVLTIIGVIIIAILIDIVLSKGGII